MIDWINHRSGAKAQPSTVCNGVDVVCWRASSNNLVVAVPSRLPICFLLEAPATVIGVMLHFSNSTPGFAFSFVWRANDCG